MSQTALSRPRLPLFFREFRDSITAANIGNDRGGLPVFIDATVRHQSDGRSACSPVSAHVMLGKSMMELARGALQQLRDF
ncbi:hypothetical protein SAMN03097708_02881 [Thiohalomonas denitrificans]|uniref:Uncharacterized protein n=1 Tax=Thiohalomonas denitrificans TaxID=415747 RepID=A0A1G5QW36_9GAMM|nr:hypothetical protein SAMN03097708_02881 [Thiohalomonas denitrificans]